MDNAHYERIVGRLSELEDLERAIIQHRVALVHGPSGIGKTRFLRAFSAKYGTCLYTAETKAPRQMLQGIAEQLKRHSILPGATYRQWHRFTVPSQKGIIQSVLASHRCTLILDQLSGPSAALSRLVKDLHYMGRTPMVIAARSAHMEDIGTLFPLVAQRAQQIHIAEWNKEIAMEFARRIAFQIELKAERCEEILGRIVQLGRGNPGAITTMIEMGKLPRYRVNNLVKVNILYVDFCISTHSGMHGAAALHKDKNP